MQVRGSVVIITGASSGIGRAAALEFGRRGASVVLAARREDRLHDTAQRVRARGGEAFVISCDVAKLEDRETLVRATLAQFGRIDVLLNNAGFGFSGTVEETPEEVMRELLEVNYLAAFNLTRAVLPQMRRQRAGHIVNVSSVVGKISFPLHGAYAASKFALCAMTDALRGELAGSGVTASVVLPATTRTEFFAVQRTAGGAGTMPAGPQHSPERVARAIVRAVEHPTPEVNLVPLMRLAYGLNACFPALRDIAGRMFYARQERARSRDREHSAEEAETGV